MKEIRGIVLPLMTPFTDDGELDERITCELTDFVLGAKVHALFLLGSFGQGPVMRIDQRKRFAEIVVKQVRGKIPVIIHIGTADVYSTTELATHARSIECDAIAAVAPYYYSDHTEYEVLQHYKEIERVVDVPLMIYNNPPYSGYDITPGLMLRLREEVPQIFGTKLSTDTLETALSYISALPKDFAIFGLASSLMPGALYGIRGTIIPPMMAYPELAVSLWKALETRSLEEALKCQMTINQLQKTMRGLGKIYGRAVQCEAVRLRGFPIKKFPRWATKPLSDSDREMLADAMRTAGVDVVGSRAAR